MTQFGTGQSYNIQYNLVFCNKDDVISNVLDRKLGTAQADWNEADIYKRIEEASNYVKAKLYKFGYADSDLKKGTDTAPLIRDITKNYARYCIVRDLYQGNAPSQVNSEPIDKWLQVATNLLTEIENNKLQILNIDGTLLQKSGIDSRYKVIINTSGSRRLVTTDNSASWNDVTDDTNNSQDVVGLR